MSSSFSTSIEMETFGQATIDGFVGNSNRRWTKAKKLKWIVGIGAFLIGIGFWTFWPSTAGLNSEHPCNVNGAVSEFLWRIRTCGQSIDERINNYDAAEGIEDEPDYVQFANIPSDIMDSEEKLEDGDKVELETLALTPRTQQGIIKSTERASSSANLVEELKDYVDQYYLQSNQNEQTIPLTGHFLVNYDKAWKVGVQVSISVLTINSIKPNVNRKDHQNWDHFNNTRKRQFNANYLNSGYDRGHIVPFANFRQNNQLARMTMHFSNVFPQVPGNNRGIYLMIEMIRRRLVVQYKSTIVFTGTLFNRVAGQQTDLTFDENLGETPVATHIYTTIIVKQVYSREESKQKKVCCEYLRWTWLLENKWYSLDEIDTMLVNQATFDKYGITNPFLSTVGSGKHERQVKEQNADHPAYVTARNGAKGKMNLFYTNAVGKYKIPIGSVCSKQTESSLK